MNFVYSGYFCGLSGLLLDCLGFAARLIFQENQDFIYDCPALNAEKSVCGGAAGFSQILPDQGCERMSMPSCGSSCAAGAGQCALVLLPVLDTHKALASSRHRGQA